MSFQADSIIDQLYPRNLTSFILPRQRFIETFQGDSLDIDRWTFSAGSGSMEDAIDEGFNIVDTSRLHFNNIRQYDELGCIFITIVRRVAAVGEQHAGLYNDLIADPDDDRTVIQNTDTQSVLRLITSATAGDTAVNLVTTENTNFYTARIECKSASVIGSINGILEATSTTTLPQKRLQPGYRCFFGTSSRIRYCEVYNT